MEQDRPEGNPSRQERWDRAGARPPERGDAGKVHLTAPGRVPTPVLYPRIVRRPVLGSDWITRDQLEAQLRALARAGLRWVDFPTFLGRLLGDDPPDDRPEVLFLFRDSDRAFVELAWPLLNRWQVRPVLFVATAYVGRRGPGGLLGSGRPQLGWSELRSLLDEGVDVEVRGHFGIDLAGVPEEMAYGDLVRARRELGRRLDIEPVAVAYPGGRAPIGVQDIAHRAGFELGFVGHRAKGAITPLALPSLEPGAFSRPGWLLRQLGSGGGRGGFGGYRRGGTALRLLPW